MSAAHDGHAGNDAAHHDASDHDHFDNEPIQELAAEEPRTPTWIPLLGLALFFLAGTAWLVLDNGDDEAKPKSEPAAVVQAAPPPEGVAAPNPVIQPRPQPAQIGSGGVRQLTPEQAAQIQKQIDAMRAAQQAGKPPNAQVARPVPQ